MHGILLELDVGDEFELTLADGNTVSAEVTDVDETPEFYEMGADADNGSRYILGVTKDGSPAVMFDEWDSEEEMWEPVDEPESVTVP